MFLLQWQVSVYALLNGMIIVPLKCTYIENKQVKSHVLTVSAIKPDSNFHKH